MRRHDRILTNNLTKYKYPSDTHRAVTGTLDEYEELQPKMETFSNAETLYVQLIILTAFNDGSSRELLCLEGTIPVRYLDATYNIPIAIFLLENYPHNAPMVYVRPTSSMQIKPSDYVDSNGLVQLPYIEEWKHPGSDLFSLVGVLRVVFGEKSPVFSKAVPPPSQKFEPSIYPPQLPIPPPENQPPYNNIPQLGSGWHAPSSVGGMPMPQQPNFLQANITERLNNSQFPAGGPPHTQGIGFFLPRANTTATSAPQSDPLNDGFLRISLLSGINEKLQRHKIECQYQSRDEVEALKQMQGDLQRGGHTINDMLTRMKNERQLVVQSHEALSQKVGELTELLERLRESQQEPVNVDEAVDTTAPLYRQLVSAFAEEQALGDAIYYLGEAIGRTDSNLEVYLKKIRELSRQQFMCRLTVKKCREKAGLPCS